MKKRILTHRGKQMLSSILLVGVIYLLSPTSVSYDRFSANRLLLWLFALLIFIYFGVAVTISLVMRVLRARYSVKVCSFIFSLCLNDMLIFTVLLTALHLIFMLSTVNTIGVLYKWVIKGINFSVGLCIADMVVVVMYFLNLYKNSNPAYFIDILFKTLNKNLQENNKKELDEKLAVLKDFLKSYPFAITHNNLEPILASDEALKILLKIKDEDEYLPGIFELIVFLFFHLLSVRNIKSAYNIFEIILEYSKNIINLRKRLKFLIFEEVEKRQVYYFIKLLEQSKNTVNTFSKSKLFDKYLITIGFCKPSTRWAKRMTYRVYKK